MAFSWFGIRRVPWGCPCNLVGLLVLGLMGMRGVVAVGDLKSSSSSSSSTSKYSNCKFPAIYNFGDSNSDTGGRSAAFDALPPPNGETFFGKPSGRICDGRLIIDFIAEELGLPYLSAYLDSVGTSFRKGANFAVAGASIRQGEYNPRCQQFKSRSLQKLAAGKKSAACKKNLPRQEDFSKALYTFDIGQNDLSFGFQYNTEDQVRASIPDMLDQFSSAIQRLYDEGGKTFWVNNTGPVGCLPYPVIYYPNKDGSHLDQNGCVRSRNEVAQEFNRQLKDRVTQLRTRFPLAAFTYVDVYSAKYDLITNAKNQGFVDPLKFCCGSYYGYQVDCGKTAVINGTVYGLCGNPSSYVSWDGFHYTQEANRRVGLRILNGSVSYPPIPITQACHASSSLYRDLAPLPQLIVPPD